MGQKSFIKVAVIVALFLTPVVLLLWSFPPYEICVRYYTREAAPSMGPGAVEYAEGLCEKKLHFWKS